MENIDTYYKDSWHAFYSAKSIKSAKKHSYTEEEKNKKIIKIYIQIFIEIIIVVKK